MSRLNELVAELCPDGVEYRPLGQCLSSLRTGLNPRKNFVLNPPDATNYYVTVRELSGVRVCPSAKTDLVNDDALALINRRSHLTVGDVLFSGVGTVGRTAYIDEIPENWNIKEGVYALTADPACLVSKYLLWFLISDLARRQFLSGTDGGTVASLSMASLKMLRIPVPPIEVQREIGRILDSFQELDDALTAEIEAREKQIEYLIEKCFNRFANDNRVASLPLQSVCKVLKAGGDAPSDCVKGMTSPDALHPYPVFSNGTGDSALYGYAGSYVIADDAVTIAARGSIGYHTVRSGMFTPVIRLITLVPNELVMLDYLDAALSGCKLGGTVGSISQLTVPMVRNERIPVPSLDAQRTFIRELNAIRQYKEHLVRERNARRSQFTYYRDKLLTFPRKVA